jgi:hypothetical protein
MDIVKYRYDHRSRYAEDLDEYFDRTRQLRKMRRREIDPPLGRRLANVGEFHAAQG